MDNALKEISKFLNVKLADLEKLPLETLVKMQTAIKDDDYMTLHHVGYAVNINK